LSRPKEELRFAGGAVEKVPGTANTGRTKVSEEPHPGRLGCGFLFWRVEKVAGTENMRETVGKNSIAKCLT
jgi:hypothetical protein